MGDYNAVMTQLHLVGGFLGSGKTTAIIQACKTLMAHGQRTGVITNDQGKYLVDTAFFRFAADGEVPALEVTGGCFCCNYDDLNGRLEQLLTTAKPDVIFAESVGSCADLVATVVKPLLSLRTASVRPSSFSVFADIRLMRLLLTGEELPFNENINYIFEKQIEEAGLLVMNKHDLLPPERTAQLLKLARQKYPEKEILTQSSLEPNGVMAWLERLEQEPLTFLAPALEIDYQKYGAGEADLAWLDQTIRLRGVNLRSALVRWIEALLASLEDARAPIGHMKMIITPRGGTSVKISFTTPVLPGWQKEIPEIDGDVEILLNGRVQMAASELQRLVAYHLQTALHGSASTVEIENAAAFHPGFPRPTHRLVS